MNQEGWFKKLENVIGYNDYKIIKNIANNVEFYFTISDFMSAKGHVKLTGLN